MRTLLLTFAIILTAHAAHSGFDERFNYQGIVYADNQALHFNTIAAFKSYSKSNGISGQWETFIGIQTLGSTLEIPFKSISTIKFLRLIDSKIGLFEVEVEYLDGNIVKGIFYAYEEGRKALDEDTYWLRFEGKHGNLDFNKISQFRKLEKIHIEQTIKRDSKGNIYPSNYIYSPTTGEILQESSK